MIRITPIFEVTIESGQIVWPEGENLRLVKFLYGRSGKYQLYLKRPLKRKNRKLENYLWGVVYPIIAQETGEDDLLKLHAVFKSMFLKQMIELKSKGRISFYEVVGRTHGMTSAQHNEFVEKVVRYAGTELGIIIPEPDPNYDLPVLVEKD